MLLHLKLKIPLLPHWILYTFSSFSHPFQTEKSNKNQPKKHSSLTALKGGKASSRNHKSKLSSHVILLFLFLFNTHFPQAKFHQFFLHFQLIKLTPTPIWNPHDPAIKKSQQQVKFLSSVFIKLSSFGSSMISNSNDWFL